jgi:intraflagellar transport protein 140
VCAAARWFEDQKEAKNAILLYSRAGRLNRALALCFAMKQYDALDEISDTLTSKTDPSVLVRCGRYFVESERWSKAAQCFALARQFDEVITLCNKHNIKLPSSVIQELSEMKADPEVMKRFASLCEQQGAFQTAATLYVKFKDHIAAMKALIRSGETDKVIKFANLVKKRETYILAGNYLQTLNPRQGDTTFDQVVALYKKAGATDKLGKFYEAVARSEIDEYQEYAKGLDLIRAGLKLVEETPDVKQKDQIVAQMQKKIRLIEMYLEAQGIVKKDPKKAMVTAVEILRNPLVESVMRTDDVYVLMVQASVAQGNFKNAHKILEDLRQNGTDISWLMDAASIQRIYKEVGATYTPPAERHAEDEYDVVDDDALDDVVGD